MSRREANRRTGRAPRRRRPRRPSPAVSGLAARRCDDRAAGDPAEALPVERRRRGVEVTDGAGVRVSECDGPVIPSSGTFWSKITSRPRRSTTRASGSLRARVGCGDRQRARRTGRARDGAEARPGLAVVAGGSDDDRVQRERARDRGRLRPVGERRVRLGDAEQCDPDGVVAVTVAVRVDRALEAGDQLVGAAEHELATVARRLPAGDPDREDRRARRHAVHARPVRPHRRGSRPARCRGARARSGAAGWPAPRRRPCRRRCRTRAAAGRGGTAGSGRRRCRAARS